MKSNVPDENASEFFNDAIEKRGKSKHLKEQIEGNIAYAKRRAVGLALGLLNDLSDNFHNMYAQLEAVQPTPESHDAVAAAFEVGRIVGAIQGLEVWGSNRTKKAVNARRLENVQEIIERAAKDHWTKYPARRGNLSETASNIFTIVKAKLSELTDLPTAWQVNNWLDEPDKKAARERKLTENIRKRLKRMVPPDNRQSSGKKAG